MLSRRLYLGSELQRIQNVEEMRANARSRLPDFAWQYIESGSGDEHTLERNRSVFREIRFTPRTLVDTDSVDLSVELFGKKYPAPLIVAPTGFNGLAWPRGDSALARAAASMNLPFSLSSFSNESLEVVATQSRGTNWFQLYAMENRSISEQLVDRAQSAGYQALVVTTDANVASSREWQRRCYRAPGKLTLRHQIDAALHPRWLLRLALHSARAGTPIFANLEPFFDRRQLGATRSAPLITGQLRPKITWRDIERLRKQWHGTLILKGVLSVEDAIIARDSGVNGIVLTNHGGRQLDEAISPMELLPTVREALPDMTILIDSGFRRGSDVLKAIGLGASAVMVGRATLYGVAAFGEAGARRSLEILTTEIQRTLQLLGCTSIHANLRRYMAGPSVHGSSASNACTCPGGSHPSAGRYASTSKAFENVALPDGAPSTMHED